MLKPKSAPMITVMMVFLIMVLLSTNTAATDDLKRFIVSQLDGRGTVDVINVDARIIIVDDRLYQLSKNINVFDVKHKTNVRVGRIRAGNHVGFKTSALKKPTAPYDQLITKIWLLPNDRF